MNTITLDGNTVELHENANGLYAPMELGGVRHIIHVTVTSIGRTAATPSHARWSTK